MLMSTRLESAYCLLNQCTRKCCEARGDSAFSLRAPCAQWRAGAGSWAPGRHVDQLNRVLPALDDTTSDVSDMHYRFHTCTVRAALGRDQLTCDIDLTNGAVLQYAVAVAEQRATREFTRVQRRIIHLLSGHCGGLIPTTR